MKALIVFIMFLVLFTVFFFLFSFFGLLWGSKYSEIISNPDWFVGYSLLLGWWLAGVPTWEFAETHLND